MICTYCKEPFVGDGELCGCCERFLEEQQIEEHLEAMYQEHLKEENNMEFKTKSGTVFARNYNRVVIGGQGPYIEFESEHIVCQLETEPGQEYRGKGKYTYVKYLWYRPIGDSSVKVYHQQRGVDYADYQVDKFYVSPNDLEFEGTLYAEQGNAPGIRNATTYTKEGK